MVHKYHDQLFQNGKEYIRRTLETDSEIYVKENESLSS